MRKIEHRYFYHGSPVELKVGDYLLPSRQTNSPRYSDADRDQIYCTTDVCYALMIANANDKGQQRSWLYRVEPVGPLKPHDTEIHFGYKRNWQRGSAVGGLHFTAAKALILARCLVPDFFYEHRQAFFDAYLALFTSLQTEDDLFFRFPDPLEDPNNLFNYIIRRGQKIIGRRPSVPPKIPNKKLKIVKVTKK
jgi:hypothetical protein